jgi:hypothetical protein
MRRRLPGVVVLCAGLVLLVPAAVLLWASWRFTFAFSDLGLAAVGASLLTGAGCLTIGVRRLTATVMRRSPPE